MLLRGVSTYIDSDDEYEPVVAASARKHNLGEVGVIHAYRHPIRLWAMEDDLTMIIGADRTGRILEVGVVRAAGGTDILVHAMPARDEFMPKER